MLCELVREICGALSKDTRGVLARTEYSRIVNAAVALFKPPNTPYVGYAFTEDVVPGAEIEMEHLRAPNRCPEGTGMAGEIFWDGSMRPRFGRRGEFLDPKTTGTLRRSVSVLRGLASLFRVVCCDILILHSSPLRLR